MTDLERLIAIEDIRALQSRHVRFADLKDWQALVGLFLPDAAFTPYDVEGKPQVVMTGRDEIARRVSASVGKGTALHHLLSYEIEVESPTHAHGIWAMEDWIDRSIDDGTTGAPPPFKTMHGCGHYHTDYEKVAAWENPDAMIEGIRETFRGLRRCTLSTNIQESAFATKTSSCSATKM